MIKRILLGLGGTPYTTVAMQRALINFINNAIEASGAGQKVVLTAADAKNHLAIKIKDHGSDMRKEALEKLFSPFFTTKKGGTGLGMPVAKKIIEAHNGTIRIDSTQGMGTEVIVGKISLILRLH